jgi:hypothetical protein
MGEVSNHGKSEKPKFKNAANTRQIESLDAVNVTHEFVLMQGADVFEEIVALADRDLWDICKSEANKPSHTQMCVNYKRV